MSMEATSLVRGLAKDRRGRSNAAAAFCFAALALIDCTYLAASYYWRIPPRCGFFGDCAALFLNPASFVRGIPLAYFGFATYGTFVLAVFGMGFVGGTPAQVALRGLRLAGRAALFVQLCLLAYAVLRLHAFCPLCWISGICFFGFWLSLELAPPVLTWQRPTDSVRVAYILAAGAVAFGALHTWDRVQRSSVASDLDLIALSRYDPGGLFSDGGIASSSSVKRRTYLAFYDPGCSACGYSFGSISGLLSSDPGARLVVRFATPQDRTDRTALVAAFLTGMKDRDRAFRLTSELFTKDGMKTSDADLKKTGILNLSVTDPTVKRGLQAMGHAETVCDVLQIAHKPCVICFEGNGARYEVNPANLKPVGF